MTPAVPFEVDRKTVAIHEAGHAVVAHRLGEPITAMFIDELHGSTVMPPLLGDLSPERVAAVASVYLAGPIAAAIYLGVQAVTFAPTGELLDDVTKAAELVGRMPGITSPGISKLLRAAGARTTTMLQDRANWNMVEQLAIELLSRGSLTFAEVAAIVPLWPEIVPRQSSDWESMNRS